MSARAAEKKKTSHKFIPWSSGFLRNIGNHLPQCTTLYNENQLGFQLILYTPPPPHPKKKLNVPKQPENNVHDKSTVAPLRIPRRRREANLHPFLTSELDEGEW